MQLNVRRITAAYHENLRDSEAVMPELSMLDSSPAANESLKADAAAAATRFTNAGATVLGLMFGTQKMLFEETVFASNEVLDRAQTETHLLSEFVSKMAGSHSVKDLRTMFEECSRHQIEFLRRDSERLFKHGERMLETASNLLANRPRP
jgi:hypothetical protein